MSAVHVTVNGALVRRNNSRLEDFIEAAEPVVFVDGQTLKGSYSMYLFGIGFWLGLRLSPFETLEKGVVGVLLTFLG